MNPLHSKPSLGLGGRSTREIAVFANSTSGLRFTPRNEASLRKKNGRQTVVLSWLDRYRLRHRLRNRVRLRFGAWRRNEIWIRSRLWLWIGLGPRMGPGHRWRDRCCYREKRHFWPTPLMSDDRQMHARRNSDCESAGNGEKSRLHSLTWPENRLETCLECASQGNNNSEQRAIKGKSGWILAQFLASTHGHSPRLLRASRHSRCVLSELKSNA